MLKLNVKIVGKCTCEEFNGNRCDHSRENSIRFHSWSTSYCTVYSNNATINSIDGVKSKERERVWENEATTKLMRKWQTEKRPKQNECHTFHVVHAPNVFWIVKIQRHKQNMKRHFWSTVRFDATKREREGEKNHQICHKIWKSEWDFSFSRSVRRCVSIN